MEQKKYLDQAGLSTLWSRIVAKVGSESDTLKGLIQAEASRADTAEKANAAAIAAVKADVDAFFADADLTEDAKDTLKELQEYIASDETAASEMLASINGIKSRLNGLGEDAGAVKDYVDNAISALTSGDLADVQQALEELTDYVGEIPSSSSADSIVEWVQEVIAGLSTSALEARIEAIEEDYETAAKAQAKADKALTDAKAYTDLLANGAVATNTASIEEIIAAMPIALTTEEIDAAING